ncbi:hypothetical protein CRM22_009384 [Opisthorchis felineus]|uniref:Uncharacterized protein n=1 Tax=Opisthorchis felineus TaxID=147828 RepID=A0A4S2LEX2_OPIFE|nr:hypothetical protein CRM22_009384 [Opisthorchis felineus]
MIGEGSVNPRHIHCGWEAWIYRLVNVRKSCIQSERKRTFWRSSFLKSSKRLSCWSDKKYPERLSSTNSFASYATAIASEFTPIEMFCSTSDRCMRHLNCCRLPRFTTVYWIMSFDARRV